MEPRLVSCLQDGADFGPLFVLQVAPIDSQLLECRLRVKLLLFRLVTVGSGPMWVKHGSGEAEVLVECVSIKEVVNSMKFDSMAAAHSGDLAGIVSKLTLMGEVPTGLHYVVTLWRLG